MEPKYFNELEDISPSYYSWFSNKVEPLFDYHNPWEETEDINYKLNNVGLRCDDFHPVPNPENNIVFAGCEVTIPIDVKYENGWVTNHAPSVQPIVRVYKNSGLVNRFPIDVYERFVDLEDLEVRVYVNGKRLNKEKITVSASIPYKLAVLDTDVALTDVVTLKCFSKQKKSENGYYEIPVNLQNNPLNEDISEFTLGQVIDHVDTIVDNIRDFKGAFPGNNNLRDIGELSQYGTRFVQHSGPLNLALYHFGSKSANLIKAMDQARNDYGQFKRAFLIAATNSGIDTDPKRHVDYVLQEMVKDKTKSRAYFLSDMFGFSAHTRIEISVLDSRIKVYPLSNKFNLKNSSANISN